ncbi:MSHA biogenesis protein MshK [Pseudoduganella chitinolytica]|uniref:MSHA biogenesis protein MshK n=1 Tax=Pseudoduganella chitinolytica TaxID=34070 RepID=A0ABY8BJB1_9BURK|nr:MSHA biogenesis protein MshK [Pseudoduganella chitinolytica]WEF34777.1 MSHA biogenesis protein MshK [Pseudoduganella chitinolytica]
MRTPLLALAGLLWGATASAQVAGDPTLPPPSLYAPATAPAAARPALPELQSILVSREAGGRRVAVISGEMVRQGSRFHGATVERVGENEVVLRRGRATQVLKLYQGRPPAVVARPAPTSENNAKKETQ